MEMVSYQFFLRDAHAKKKAYSIYLRVVFSKTDKLILSSKVQVTLKAWDPVDQRVRTLDDEHEIKNEALKAFKGSISSIVAKLQKKNVPLSSELVKSQVEGLSRQMEDAAGLLTIFELHNTKYKAKVGIDYAIASWKNYNSTFIKVSGFIKECLNRQDIFLQELDYKFLVDFEDYLKVDKGIGHNTTMKYIRCLKAIINYCIRNKRIIYNPFSEFKCGFKHVNRRFLNLQELKQIEKVKPSKPQLQMLKDAFLFSCYTGLAYSDLYSLKIGEVKLGLGNKFWIEIFRTKTGTRVSVPLIPKAIKLFEKYSGAKSNDDKLFCLFTNQVCNRYLKDLATSAALKKQLTFHQARHTFATTVTLSNGVPIESVSKMLGHSSLTTTQIYAKVVDSKIEQDMGRLIKKLR